MNEWHHQSSKRNKWQIKTHNYQYQWFIIVSLSHSFSYFLTRLLTRFHSCSPPHFDDNSFSFTFSLVFKLQRSSVVLLLPKSFDIVYEVFLLFEYRRSVFFSSSFSMIHSYISHHIQASNRFLFMCQNCLLIKCQFIFRVIINNVMML